MYLPGVKRPGRGVDHPPSSNTEVKESVALYIYYPSGRLLGEPQRLTTINAILKTFQDFWNDLNVKKVKQSSNRPGVAQRVPEVKVPRFHDNGTGWL